MPGRRSCSGADCSWTSVPAADRSAGSTRHSGSGCGTSRPNKFTQRRARWRSAPQQRSWDSSTAGRPGASGGSGPLPCRTPSPMRPGSDRSRGSWGVRLHDPDRAQLHPRIVGEVGRAVCSLGVLRLHGQPRMGSDVLSPATGQRRHDARCYSLSQRAMSPADGIRPALTTWPSMTRPGVLMTPRAMMSL
jgi:hypothetical protein